MCGIAGFLDTKHRLSTNRWHDTLSKMGEALLHRGPDAGDIWSDFKHGVGFSHRRLSILDLSPTGAQPMTSHSNRFVMIFNGEIYNHLDIRKNLNNINWRGHSDTETLLAGFDTWGIEATILKTVGMFAIALWDKTEKILYLIRDRMGEKPLYYSIQNGLLIFASELKAILAHPLFEPKINREALSLYTSYSYIPTPHSIYKNAKKLEQGSILALKGSDLSISFNRKYWDLNAQVEKYSKIKFSGSDTQAIEILEAKLLEAVNIQQIADVPLGAFLSGGIDSSIIVALMQKTSSRPVKTFTIGFEDKNFNEAKHAKAIAKHLGTEHSELIISDEEIRKVIPLLPQIYDEPFSDSSQIPTYLVSKLAREHVTVSLSGDAGDELFCGYNRYWWTQNVNKYPHKVKALAKPLVNLLRHIARAGRQSLLEEKLSKLTNVLNLKDGWEIYQWLIQTWKIIDGDIILGVDKIKQHKNPFSEIKGISFIEQLMYYDLQTYLTDDNLHKLDRAGMAVSLESRVPFLDHRVIEFALQLPSELKYRNRQSKWILRQILYKSIPPNLLERPKMGFSVPIDSWLRGPMKDWAASLLNPSLLRQDAYFNSEVINQCWQEHLSGSMNHGNKLWNILIFQAWLREK